MRSSKGLDGPQGFKLQTLMRGNKTGKRTLEKKKQQNKLQEEQTGLTTAINLFYGTVGMSTFARSSSFLNSTDGGVLFRKTKPSILK